MPKMRQVLVTKHFPDGRTEECEATLRSSTVTAPWFELDGEFYFMPSDHTATFKPSHRSYNRLTVVRL